MVLGGAGGGNGATAGVARAPGSTAVRDLGRVSLAHAPPVRLGPLMIEPALRRVAHDDGREEMVEPRVMQVLVALLRAEGAILSRDDLAACCWDGRIVGDDAINRVLSRLRRIADGIAAGIFRIETITKVGYRARLEASEAAAANRPALTPDAQESEPGQKPPRIASRSWLTRAGWLLAAVAAGAALLFLVRPTGGPESPPRLRLAQFVNLSPELPASLPASLREELLAAFGEDDAIPVVSSSAATAESGEAYALGGTLRRAGDRLRFTVRLTSGTNGALLWSDAIDGPAAEPAVALRGFATELSRVLGCGLTGVAEHPRPISHAAGRGSRTRWRTRSSGVTRLMPGPSATRRRVPPSAR